MTDHWEQTLQTYREKNYRVIGRESLTHATVETTVAGLFVPPSVQLFLQKLSDNRYSLWDAFFGSVAPTNNESNDDDIRHMWKPLLEYTTHLAVIYGEASAWKSPDQWSYLIEVTGLFENHRFPSYFLLHPPATQEHIQQAEAVIGCALPPTFVRFLRWTNGLGLGAHENWYIHGVGSDRAPWPAITSWTRFSFAYHEIAHTWWSWQDQYRYEREMDQERGVVADRTAEQICLPFAQLGDDLCFDRSKPDRSGEYPVLSWDHETRTTFGEFPSFGSWFLDGIIQGKELADESFE